MKKTWITEAAVAATLLSFGEPMLAYFTNHAATIPEPYGKLGVGILTALIYFARRAQKTAP